MRVELSNGGWAELRDPASITEAGRREFKTAGARTQDRLSSAHERADALADTDDYMIAMFVSAWSFEGVPIPQAGIVHLRSLPGLDYDTLRNACRPLVDEAFIDFKPNPDQSSPFLAAGTSPVGVGGSQAGRPASVAAGVASVPAGEADRVD